MREIKGAAGVWTVPTGDEGSLPATTSGGSARLTERAMACETWADVGESPMGREKVQPGPFRAIRAHMARRKKFQSDIKRKNMETPPIIYQLKLTHDPQSWYFPFDLFKLINKNGEQWKCIYNEHCL